MFRAEHTDSSRYFPGEGFRRIPESWVRINNYICDQLETVPSSQKIAITYEDLCMRTGDTLRQIAGRFEIDDFLHEDVPSLHSSSVHKWKTTLCDKELRIIGSTLAEMTDEVRRLQGIYPHCVTDEIRTTVAGAEL